MHRRRYMEQSINNILLVFWLGELLCERFVLSRAGFSLKWNLPIVLTRNYNKKLIYLGNNDVTWWFSLKKEKVAYKKHAYSGYLRRGFF